MGFSGVGGAAITSAYTVVLCCFKQYAVYFGSRYAYCVSNPNEKFFEDLVTFGMQSVKTADLYLKLEE